jgi:hypothetical protein
MYRPDQHSDPIQLEVVVLYQESRHHQVHSKRTSGSPKPSSMRPCQWAPSLNLPTLGVYRACMKEPNGHEDKKQETRKERQFSSHTPIKS